MNYTRVVRLKKEIKRNDLVGIGLNEKKTGEQRIAKLLEGGVFSVERVQYGSTKTKIYLTDPVEGILGKRFWIDDNMVENAR